MRRKKNVNEENRFLRCELNQETPQYETEVTFTVLGIVRSCQNVLSHIYFDEFLNQRIKLSYKKAYIKYLYAFGFVNASCESAIPNFFVSCVVAKIFRPVRRLNRDRGPRHVCPSVLPHGRRCILSGRFS
jgi:hypothetical protein